MRIEKPGKRLPTNAHGAAYRPLHGFSGRPHLQVQGRRTRLSISPALVESQTGARPFLAPERPFRRGVRGYCVTHSRIFVTTPAPTVLPPSRIANRRLSSMAIGECSSTVILILSPGMHISASLPSSDSRLRIDPVTSVV